MEPPPPTRSPTTLVAKPMINDHTGTSPSEVPLSWFVIQVTGIASLGGCLFGYDMGAISGVLPQLAVTWGLTDPQKEWIVSILYLGGGFGAMVGGALCDCVGRKTAILGTDVIFVVGAMMLSTSDTVLQILLGRVVVGFAIAVSGIADVSYLHEIAPPHWRGAIVSVNEACISLGFLLAYVAGYQFSNADRGDWRWIFGLPGILALIQFLGMWTMPESPTWLAERGRWDESLLAWQRIHGRQTPPPVQLQPPQQVLSHGDEQMILPSATQTSPPLPTSTTQISTTCTSSRRIDSKLHYEAIGVGHAELHGHSFQLPYGVTIPEQLRAFGETVIRYRKQAYITLFLSIAQQLSGQINVLNYAPLIFAQATNDENAHGWSMLVIGLTKFLITVLVIWKIEDLGRRFLLLSGMAVISMGLLCLIVAFGGYRSSDSDSWSTNLSGFQFALPGVLMVVCGYSMSFGPLTWLLTSELFPTDIRGRALGAMQIVSYLSASFVTRTFLSAESWLGPSEVFAIYFLATIMGALFSYLAIPDTGAKTVEQVEIALFRMWWWRFDHFLARTPEGEPIATTEPYALHDPTHDHLPVQIRGEHKCHSGVHPPSSFT